jgi:solute carrier family 25 (mitochondrial oxoglutarate transporter), member 11
MIKTEGFFSIYTGMTAALGRQCSYGTARIGFHRSISDYLLEKNGGRPLPFATKALSGMASGSIAVCIGETVAVRKLIVWLVLHLSEHIIL